MSKKKLKGIINIVELKKKKKFAPKLLVYTHLFIFKVILSKD